MGKKRPASHDTRKKQDSVINKRDATTQNKINNIKEKKKKEESSEKNAVEARLKLNGYYSENKINKTNSTANIQTKHQNSSNRKYVEAKKLLNLKLEKKDEQAIKQISYLTLENERNKDKDKRKERYPQKLKNEYDYPYYPKNMPLPAEKNFNLNIDFNQFDQFSPPSNQNLITKNTNNIYEYNCTFNKSNDHSSKYGAVDYNYKKRKQEMENYQKKTLILNQEYKGDNFTKRNNMDQREKDKSKDKDKDKEILPRNYLISKLMKTTSDKVSLIHQNQDSKRK